MERKKHWVSWHYTVDDTEVIKQLPVNEVAYHAGKANTQSIAIEQCMHNGIDVSEADERLCQLIAQLRIKLSLGREKVVTHKHWTKKNCPSQLLSKWDAILDRVDVIVKEKPEVTDGLINVPDIEFQAREIIPAEKRDFIESFDIEHGVKFEV